MLEMLHQLDLDYKNGSFLELGEPPVRYLLGRTLLLVIAWQLKTLHQPTATLDPNTVI